MKLRRTILITVAVYVLLVTAVTGLVGCLPTNGENGEENGENSYLQNINTKESLETFNNPDQGFYRPIYVKLSQSGISYNKNIISNATQLYHLRIDISEFSQKVNGAADSLLAKDAVDGLDNLLKYLRLNDKNAIVRFAYDPSFAGGANKEPELSVILEHVKQVSTILNQFEQTVTAIEVGLIGPWGEMHTSQIANAANINPIIEQFLSNTQNIPILVRTPKMIYDYLSIKIDDIENYVIDKNSKAYMLGIYNDGYLGSGTDLGTYTNREKEITFLSKQTAHLPYGGEVVVPSSTLHNIQTCLPEMFQIHLSYLNVEWNNEVIDKWKNSTYSRECGDEQNYYGQSAFTYISNRMGYRYLLTKSVFEYTNKFDGLSVKLSIDNLGFGNLNKTKRAKLIFVNADNQVKYEKNIGVFDGSNVNCNIDLNLENGKYKIYLCIYGEEIDGVAKYSLRFANNDIWDSNLRANKIGEVDIER